jgi:hypothetical protein
VKREGWAELKEQLVQKHQVLDSPQALLGNSADY